MIIEILVALNLVVSGASFWFTKRAIEKESKKTAVGFSEVRSHLVTQSAELHSSIASESQSTRNEATKAFTSVTEYLTEHAEALAKKTDSLEAHAKSVMDSTSQHHGHTTIPRAVCPQCERTVYRFNKRADGTILQCLDCAAKG